MYYIPIYVCMYYIYIYIYTYTYTYICPYTLPLIDLSCFAEWGTRPWHCVSQARLGGSDPKSNAATSL